MLAGGQSLIPLLRLRFARPSVLVDIGRLDDLRYVREDGDRIAIGALTRHSDLVRDPVLGAGCAVIPHAADYVGDPQVRHRGTIGGSIAHGDPASDLSTILLTLDADLVAHGPDGERTIPAADFFVGPFMTALGPRDVLKEIRVPQGRERRLPEAQPALAGLGDGRCRGCPCRRRRAGRAREHGRDPAAGTWRRGGARRRRLAGRRRRARRGRGPASGRHQRQQRVPRAPGTGSRAARARTALAAIPRSSRCRPSRRRGSSAPSGSAT